MNYGSPLPSKPLFQSKQTIMALRDVAYRDESMAVAELVDNSVDADATRVEVLLETDTRESSSRRQIQRVVELAVADEGVGMSVETLASALTYGGRGVDLLSGRRGRIGKYGMGLPTASGSQCKRFDVWTSEGRGKGVFHAFVDMENISDDEVPLVRPSRVNDWPEKWWSRVSDEVRNQGRGTLVVWSNIDKITAKPETIWSRLTERVGSIYRHRLDGGSLRIRVAKYKGAAGNPVDGFDRWLQPVDPLFLMTGTYNPDGKWRGKAMFEPWPQSKPTMNIKVRHDDLTATVELRFSIAKQEALVWEKSPAGHPVPPGKTLRGKFTNRWKGISVVREDRELFRDESFTIPGGHHAPQHRWWGCEVRFGFDADKIFGVDSQKQSAVRWSEAVKNVLDAHDLESEQPAFDFEDNEEKDDGSKTVLELVYTINKQINHLFNDARKRVSGGKIVRDVGERRFRPEKKAEGIAEEIADRSLPEGKEGRERRELSEETRKNLLAIFFQRLGSPDPGTVAEEIVARGLGFQFVSRPLGSHHMFKVDSLGAGVAIVTLNTDHKLHECLEKLERESKEEDRMALVALLVAILAWSRFELESDKDEQKELEMIAGKWGKMAGSVYEDLAGLLPMQEGDG